MEERPRLSEMEELVMAALWDGGKDQDMDFMTVMETVNMRFDKDWKPSSVETYLKRLQKKGYIDIYKIGRYCYYHPVVQLDDYRAWKLAEVRNVLFKGRHKTMQAFIRKMEGNKNAE